MLRCLLKQSIVQSKRYVTTSFSLICSTPGHVSDSEVSDVVELINPNSSTKPSKPNPPRRQCRRNMLEEEMTEEDMAPAADALKPFSLLSQYESDSSASAR